MKSYTDLEQSKMLAEILPIQSADCFWDYDDLQKYHRISWFEDGYNKESQLRLNENNVCAWSLAALLDVIKDDIKIEKTLFDQSDMFTYSIIGDCCEYRTYEHEELVDACYEMILKLNEQKLL